MFQNKIYPSVEEAHLAESGSIQLFLCKKCGFVWNVDFEPGRLDYDSKYQNEQSYSMEFKRHLDVVKKIIEDNNPKRSQVVEIGCGKGTFMNILQDSGYSNILGYDPAYEGNSPLIKKCYYPPKGNYSQADLFIMRHVLEHISDPFNFLKKISSANCGRGKVYIEVPDFEWIIKHGAFWDISYEHCNYFTQLVISNIFPGCETGYLFGDQYLYAIGDFIIQIPGNNELGNEKVSMNLIKFEENIKHCREFINEHPNLVLWGAGAKGANFARMMDPQCENIKGIVDINPKKQGQYIAASAHFIRSPGELKKDKEIKGIIVMNENYSQEIKSIMKSWNGDYFILDKDFMTI